MTGLEDIKPMTEAEKLEAIRKCSEGVKRNSKLPNKGFDLEEVEGMTKAELKEYGIDKRKAVDYLKRNHEVKR
jgi:hypothetical protein